MSNVRSYALLLLLLFVALVQAPSAACQAPAAGTAPAAMPAIPRVWDDEQLAGMDLPLPSTTIRVRHMPSAYYYRLAVRPIYRSYPVYGPGREPAGYLEWLARQEPAIAFDPATLETTADWVRAGERVFDAPLGFDGIAPLPKIRDPRWLAATRMPVARDGTVPFFRYVIREKGKIEVGDISCATCHTRVLPNGTAIKGAQGNLPLEHIDELAMRVRGAGPVDAESLQALRGFTRQRFAAPWVQPDPLRRLDTMSGEDIAAAYGRIPPGVQARDDASIFSPVQVADLIGLKDRRYFDRTGRTRHRDIGDLMRYAAFVQGALGYARYGDYLPAGSFPEPPRARRYSDEQLYALALYLYSLQPPVNPNRPDALSRRGEGVFTREGCVHCHTPPLYTNNRLAAVDGFMVPADHPAREDILPLPIGTDPALTLFTRKATGLYKVPSLRGLWYRGPLAHDGAVATLEDWFDAARLRDDYVPTGYAGSKGGPHAVKGHLFGLALSPADKRALIAFLRTL